MAATSNRIGHPVRNRKKNRLIYNEDEETSFGPNRLQLYTNPIPILPSKQQKTTQNVPSKSQDETTPTVKGKINKNIGTNLANSLRRILKLPKPNNWLNHEWFYGTIDQVLFLDENEFNFCLNDSFPQLKTRHMSRLEWSQIRRLMGKPRRCSASFFEEERATLNIKRNKIRYLQQNKVSDLNIYKDLPEYIPQPLVVGTQVCALTRNFDVTNDGVFLGVIEGIDPKKGTYRVSFNKSEIGCLSIPDYEVASCDPPILAPLSSFQIKTRKWNATNRLNESGSNQEAASHQSQAIEKVISQRTSNESVSENNIGGFPIKFLSYLVKASKILTVKKEKLGELNLMNTEIERMTALNEKIPYSFKKLYAMNILELEKTNQELRFYLKKIQNHSLQFATEGKLRSLKPDVLTQQYQIESKILIQKLREKFKVSDKTSNLIINLICLLVHLKSFKDSEISSYEFESLLKALSTVQNQIHRNNHETFRNNVEIHIRHIISSISHLGNLGAFSESTNSDLKSEN